MVGAVWKFVLLLTGKFDRISAFTVENYKDETREWNYLEYLIIKKTNGHYMIVQVCCEFQVSLRKPDCKYYRKLEEVYNRYLIDTVFS